PRIAADEYRLLRLLHAAGYPAPAPVYLDDGALTIFPTPCLVIEYIAGVPTPALADSPDAPQQLPAQLAALHRPPIAPNEFAFLPEQAASVARPLATARAALRLCASGTRSARH